MEMLIGRLATAVVATVLACSAAWADWPTDKPIKMIVPFPAGGGTDYAGRLMAKHLSDKLKANIFVENRAGANGLVGLQALKGSAPDGYTIATGSDGPFIYNHGLYKERLPYDTTKDFAPIGMIMKLPAVLVIHPSVGVTTVADLIKLAKEKPGVLNYSSAGHGNFSHLSMEFFMKGAGVKMVHVPTTGTAPATLAVVQGDVQVHLNNVQTLLPLIEDKKLIALGVSEATRLKNVPNIPTIAETLPGYDMAPWVGIVAPTGTPADIVTRLSDALVDVLKDPEVIGVLEKQSLVARPMPSAEFGTFMAAEISKWNKIIDEAGIKIGQ